MAFYRKRMMVEMNDYLAPPRKRRAKDFEAVPSFNAMNLKAGLLRGIYACGFEKPTAIQQRVIKEIVQGRHVIAQAQSGTGKTVALAVSALQMINTPVYHTQAVIVSPTRELARQTQRMINRLGAFMGVKCNVYIGGTKIEVDFRKLECGQHIACGTPGRLFDLIAFCKKLATHSVRLFILDEADEVLTMSFIRHVHGIFSYLCHEIQVVLLSTTMPNFTIKMTKNFMCNPVKILISRGELILDVVDQFFVNAEVEEWKFPMLCRLLQSPHIKEAIIFCNTRAKVDWLSLNLKKLDICVDSVHAGMSQYKRNELFTRFSSGEIRLLIATDIYSRGLDTPEVSVINYDVPTTPETYLHRIGVASRYGRRGLSFSLVDWKGVEELQNIAMYYSIQIDQFPLGVSSWLN